MTKLSHRRTYNPTAEFRRRKSKWRLGIVITLLPIFSQPFAVALPCESFFLCFRVGPDFVADGGIDVADVIKPEEYEGAAQNGE